MKQADLNSKISWQAPGRKALFVTLIAADEEANKFSIHVWAMVNYVVFSPSKMEEIFFLRIVIIKQ